MIHRLRRFGSDDALGFWAERLAREGVEFDLPTDAQPLAFGDPEGLGLEVAVVATGDEPLRAVAEGIWASTRCSGSTASVPIATASTSACAHPCSKPTRVSASCSDRPGS
jgi:hypothetical protein